MTLKLAMAVVLSLGTQVASGEEIDWSHPNGNPVRLENKGFCFGLGWVTLLPGEDAKVDYGPDFNVYRVTGPGKDEWGVYSGFAGQSQPDPLHKIAVIDGVTVYRGTEKNGKVVSFNGYFVGDRSQQNHLFGNVFHDAKDDAVFFNRMRFGKVAKKLCANYWQK